MCMNDLPRVATWQCCGRESNPRPVDRKPGTLTTTPPSHTKVSRLKFISCYRKTRYKGRSEPLKGITVLWNVVPVRGTTGINRVVTFPKRSVQSSHAALSHSGPSAVFTGQ